MVLIWTSVPKARINFIFVRKRPPSWAKIRPVLKIHPLLNARLLFSVQVPPGGARIFWQWVLILRVH